MKSKGHIRYIKQWLCRIPSDVTGKGEFQLRTRGVAPEVIMRWPGSAREDADGSAQLVIDTAQGDCDARQQDTKYALALVVEDADHATCPLAFKPETKGVVEGADAEGQIAQMMRHNEVMARITAGQTESTNAALLKIVGMLSERLSTLEGERKVMLSDEAELIGQVALAQHEGADDEAKNRRLDKAIDLGETYIKHLMFKANAPPTPKSNGSAKPNGAGTTKEPKT